MYTNSYYYGDDSYWLLSFLSTYLVLLLAVLAIIIVAEWKIFTKAGEKGWKCLIPFYSNYIEFKLFWGDTRYFWALLICVLLVSIPVFGWVALVIEIVLGVLLNYKKARSFGKSEAFTLGLIFLPVIFDPILAFGSAKYIGYPEKSDTEKKIDGEVNDFVKEHFSEPSEADVAKDGYVPKKDVVDAEVVEKPVETEAEAEKADAEKPEESGD